MSNEIQYGHESKQICFEDLDKRHAEMKIRLHYDGLKSAEFFRGIITAYIEKDEDLLKIVDKIKEKRNVSKVKRNKVKKAHKNSDEIIKKFGLDEGDVENIFDILEKEYSEFL